MILLLDLWTSVRAGQLLRKHRFPLHCCESGWPICIKVTILHLAIVAGSVVSLGYHGLTECRSWPKVDDCYARHENPYGELHRFSWTLLFMVS